MSAPVYTYKCGNRPPHFHDLPGTLGETPPERVKCPVCGKAAGRYYKAPATVVYNGNGWTGAQKRG